MMNFKSPSSFIVLAAALIAACTKAEAEISLVRSDEYVSRACWFDSRGDFVAFLAFGRGGRIAVPDFVSTKCLVSGHGSDGESIISHLGTIRMIDSYGSLQRVFPHVIISDNVRTDQPLPSSESRLYYVRMRLARVPGTPRAVYAPRNILELTDMNMSFLHFLNLSREQRGRLLSEHNLGN